MSNALITRALAAKVGPTEKLVLIVLADAARDSDGRTWVGMFGKLATEDQAATLGLTERTGLTDRAIRATIGKLVDGGHVSRIEKQGKGVIYTVHPTVDGSTMEPRSARNGVPVETRSPGTTIRPAPDSSTPEPRSANPLLSQSRKAAPSLDKPANAKRSSATRLPEDWLPDALTGTAAEIAAAWPPDEMRSQVERFRDHWSSASGANARKHDWQAAFRNWVRGADERKPLNGGSIAPRSITPSTGSLGVAQRLMQRHPAVSSVR